ncbi:MAG: lactate racemase domain-containing protein [Gemmataceae bacterium]|nr:lactate racemase domain-containing protein [Gemmataceae bacterium]
MQVRLNWGRHVLELDVPERGLVATHRQALAPPIADLGAAVRAALDAPIDFPPLYRALTPDDHVAVVVDESLPRLGELLPPLLSHLQSAQVALSAITLVCPAPSTGQPWLEDLPDEFQEVRVETHQPNDRRKLSYLATTRAGRRIYLNRTVVDADQIVLLTGRGYDPLVGVRGAETALFPTLADQETQQALFAKLSIQAPGRAVSPLRQEAVEVAWLLGAPFLVQAIEGGDGEFVHIIAGPVESSGTGVKLLDARWRLEVDRLADLVVAGIGGDPARHTFDDLARAFLCCARVVKPGGRIALVTDAKPQLGAAAQLLRETDEPALGLKALLAEMPEDAATGFSWASAALEARLYLLSRLADEAVEELFATPLEKPGQITHLIDSAESCLVIPDAHRSLAVLKKS